MKASSDAAAKSAASIAAATQRAESSISGLEKEVSILNTEMQAGSRSAAILAAQLSAGEGASDAQKAKIAQLAGALFDMREAQKSASAASAEAAKQLAQQANEANRISGITSDLSNQIAILSEQQTNGARSAAILAAQLRAGASATEADKQKIGELTGQLFDMKRTTDVAAGGSKNWKSSMQQAGYQVQDFIVQVQGGQSALVAFSQQGSQLAGAFGPSGAVIGAIIALGSIIAGTLITSLNGGKNAMDALKDAAEAMDKVISVSQNGVAALSDKYANLARTNAEAATILRNQAMIEYNAAIAKIPKSINDASSSIVGFTDKLRTSFVGGIASIDEFNKNLSTVGVTADTYSAAMEQARNAGAKFTVNANAIQNTVTTLADKFGVSEQRAFELSKQLSDVANNPTPEALQRLVLELQNTESSTKSGADAIRTFLGPLTELVRVAGEAQINLSGMKKEVDNLTSGQKNLIKQSERNLALSKLQGEARARLQAQYAAEDAGFAKDDPHAKQMEDDAAATYNNTQAQKTLQSEQKKGASQADSIAQKLANLKQQSELVADSTNKLSREQAILAAQQSLGKGATKEQIALAGQYAAKKWDTANAIKAEAAAQKLLPEAAENASYKQDVEDLNTALAAKKISQEQYNQTSERLAATHQANLAKIQSQQAVTPQQEAVGGVDPVQQLANENTKKLALIQSYEQQGLITHQNAMALRAATDTQYEQARIAAQWEIFRNQSLGNEMLAASFDSLAGNTSNAFTGILTGSMSAQEAMQSLASNALNSLINGFVQMGVDWVKSAVMGAAAQTSAIATTTAAQTAGLATTTAASTAAATTTMAVWTPAAAVASIGSFGGAAAIGIAALIAAMAMAGGIAGKRKNGGPVSAGRTYQVGEGGMPEIYQASNGSQYMIPGDNGKVISNKQMNSGAGGSSVPVTINIQNYTGATVDARATQNGNGVTIDMIVADISQGGRIGQAIQQNHQAPRKARG
ncbi:tail protein (tape measure) [Enterobacter asburiae]|uniref:tail protein (tape measure) n=1 Tax=Enterobacter asburiae TaxID=61645 RepID=UPI0039B5934C